MSHPAIIWQQDWSKLQGFVLKSPFSGQILPASMHPDPLYQQDILPTSLCCKLQHGTLYAPFNAAFSTARELDRRLQFVHQSGLTLWLDLPVALSKMHGKGLHWLCRPGQKITAGTAVLQLDLPYLQLALHEIYCLATLNSPGRLSKIYSRQARVNANQDPLFVLQLTD